MGFVRLACFVMTWSASRLLGASARLGLPGYVSVPEGLIKQAPVPGSVRGVGYDQASGRSWAVEACV